MAFSLRNFFNIRKSPQEEVSVPRRSLSFSAGVTVSEDSSMQVSAFYRGVVYVSSQVAKLPWNVKDQNNKIVNNRVSYLLSLSPNPEMDAMSFRLFMVQNAIIHGNAYAEIERDTLGRPVALWPLPSLSVEPLRANDGTLVYKVVGLSFRTPGTDVYLPARDVFHLKNFHTKDGLTGQGVVAYATQTLGIGLGADRMAGNLFANGGIPSGVLKVPGVLSDEAFERVKKSWSEAHTGKKSGSVAVLEEGMDFQAVNIQPDVLQFLESRQFNVLEIARFLGVPPTKLFDAGSTKYSNQEQSNLEVATDTLDTWCRLLEMQADIKILSNRFGGVRSEFDFYELFRGDMASRSSYYSKMMQIGAISPNEIRLREGMAPYADGDRYYIAVNNYSPSDRIDEIIDSQVDKGNNQPRQVDQNVDPVQAALIQYLTGK